MSGKRPHRWARIRAHAKVNLGLEVLFKRADGYHELRTIFQTVDLHDVLHLRLTKTGKVTIACDHPAVPLDDTNLAVRAAADLLRHAGRKEGVEIRLKKNIPVAGGLGGGSSDAAAVLMALDRMLDLELGVLGLHRLARRLGADVPFFLVGGTALGVGSGDEIYPLLRQLRASVVIVDLKRPVQTARVFARLAERLTPRENSNTIYRFVMRYLEEERDALALLTNDLQGAAIEEAPDLAEPITKLNTIMSGCGASLAALSGSGASYFGVFQNHRNARQAALAAARETGLDARAGRTLTGDAYRRSATISWPLGRRVTTRTGLRGSESRWGVAKR